MFVSLVNRPIIRGSIRFPYLFCIKMTNIICLVYAGFSMTTKVLFWMLFMVIVIRLILLKSDYRPL